MVIGRKSCIRTPPIGTWLHGLHLTPPSSRSSEGFTLLEILVVLFLLAGVVVVVLPRIIFSESLDSTGRKFIGALHTLQGLAATGQKPIKLYLDIDRGTYWAKVIDGKEEKPPLDANWKATRTLPDSIRFTEVAIGQDKREFGLGEISFFPNGRIDPVTVHFKDQSNNLLALSVDSLTGAIRTSDERTRPKRRQPIPNRVKTLLRASSS